MSSIIGSLYKIEFGEAFCYCREFTVNGKDADYEDFGEKYDRDPDDAPDYCCADMRFTRYTDKAKVAKCCKKYGITVEQYAKICEELEKGLSFGSCGWCE